MVKVKKEKEKEEDKKNGKLSSNEINKIINKKAGMNVAFSLNEENPSTVKDWIPTGARWLDSIIAKGRMGGIPVGKIVEIAGLEGSGKSYMAAQIAAHAQKKDIHVIYYDSESAVDPEFLEKIGIDLDKFSYVQATSVESVLKSIEELLANSDGIRYLFIWDSFANTPSETDLLNEEFDPQSSMAKVPRVASLGMKKLTIPIANNDATLLVLNQLRTNLGDPQMMKIEPWFTPGGKALTYAYSLRIWLTKRKAKGSYIINDKNGFRIGSEVKVKLQKSRFGTEGRECTFKIIWGDDPVGIQDELSWLEAIQNSSRYEGGAWKKILDKEGKQLYTFQSSDDNGNKGWMEQMTDNKFKETILEIMDEEVIQKFEKKVGLAKNFYSVDPIEEVEDE